MLKTTDKETETVHLSKNSKTFSSLYSLFIFLFSYFSFFFSFVSLDDVNSSFLSIYFYSIGVKETHSVTFACVSSLLLGLAIGVGIRKKMSPCWWPEIRHPSSPWGFSFLSPEPASLLPTVCSTRKHVVFLMLQNCRCWRYFSPFQHMHLHL